MSGISFSVKLTWSVWSKSYGSCWYCGCELGTPGQGGSNEFTVDHVLPRKSGGDKSIENLVPCCRRCNTIKGTKTLEAFRQSYGAAYRIGVVFSQEQRDYLASIGLQDERILTEHTHESCPFWFELHPGRGAGR